MGRLPRRRPPRLSGLPMKILLFVLALFATQAQAGSAAAMSSGMVSVSTGGMSTSANFVGSFSGAAFNNNFTANVGGRSVVMPASMRIASNAGQFAANALRFNPLGLIGGALAAWAIAEGMEWINGQWTKRQPDTPLPGNLIWQSSSDASCRGYDPLATAQCGAPGGVNFTVSESFAGLIKYSFERPGSGWFSTVVVQTSTTPACPDGTIQNGSLCVGQPVPATQSDWDSLASKPLTDAAASDAAQRGVALPLESPQFNPPYQDVPLGDPVTDPVTGQKSQPKARVTPQSDGKSANVEPFSQPLDENGQPATDPETGQPKPNEAEPDKDPCALAPDRLSCIEKGEAEDVDLQTQNHGAGISPVSVGGGGSCPPDKSISLHGGTAVFSYQPICQLATMINPLVIAFAWLSAGFILIGAFRE